MKFALLHIDQSIELLLKERVRKGGKSIYKSPKETISIWGAYQILSNDLACDVPERPDLELLHEECNNIQHKYANPSQDDAVFYVDIAMRFVRRFLEDELGVALEDHIPAEYLDELFPNSSGP